MATRRDSIERGQEVIQTYSLETGFGYTPTGEDLPTVLVDLLTDLRLWAASRGVDMDLAVQLSGVHFQAEHDTPLDEEIAA